MKNCQRSQRNPSKIRPLIGPPVLQRLPMYLTKIHVPPIMTEVQSKLTNILKIFHKKSSLNVQWKSQHHIMSSRQEARAKERNTVLLSKQNRSGMKFRQSQFWMDPLFQSYLQQTVRFFLTKSEAAWLKDCSHLYLIKDRIYLLSCFIFLARAGPFGNLRRPSKLEYFNSGESRN